MSWIAAKQFDLPRYFAANILIVIFLMRKQRVKAMNDWPVASGARAATDMFQE